MDWENVAMIEYIHCFTNKNVSEHELKVTRDVNAMLQKIPMFYRKYIQDHTRFRTNAL